MPTSELTLRVPLEQSQLLRRHGWDPHTPLVLPDSPSGGRLPTGLVRDLGEYARELDEGGYTPSGSHPFGGYPFPPSLEAHLGGEDAREVHLYLEDLDSDIGFHTEVFGLLREWLEAQRNAAAQARDLVLVQTAHPAGVAASALDAFAVLPPHPSGGRTRTLLLLPRQVAQELEAHPPAQVEVHTSTWPDLTGLFSCHEEAEMTLSLWEPGGDGLFASFALAHQAAQDLLV